MFKSLNSNKQTARNWFCGLALAGIVALPLLSFAQSITFYRFKNANGVTVISTQIPSNAVRQGYDIVTSSGRLIERIAPEPTPEEKQRILEARAEEERLRLYDEDLLRRYSSVADIESDRSRRLVLLDNDIELRERGIKKIDEQTELWQSKAADEERRGQAVSAATLGKLSRLQEEKQTLISTVQQRKQERLQVIERFDKDIERFRLIRR